MKKCSYLVLLFLIINTLTIPEISAQSNEFDFTVEKAFINKSIWAQPYRYENKDIKPLTAQIIIKNTNGKNKELNFNSFTLLDEENKIRIRPNAVYYYRGDKKIYLKSKPINKNYNTFIETVVDGFVNFEAETYKPNFLGRKKKKDVESVKSLKKITFKSKKKTYYIDFPVHKNFAYGKIYYKNDAIGYAAIKK